MLDGEADVGSDRPGDDADGSGAVNDRADLHAHRVGGVSYGVDAITDRLGALVSRADEVAGEVGLLVERGVIEGRRVVARSNVARAVSAGDGARATGLGDDDSPSLSLP